MSQDLVKALGVEVRRVCVVDNSFPRSVIYLEDLRAALEKLPVVYGSKEVKSSAWCWFDKMSQCGSDTHKARLFAIANIVTGKQIGRAHV